MKNLIIVLIIAGLTTIGFAQNSANEFEIALDEVEVLGMNYEYLNAVGYRDAAEPVKLLTQKAASFDLTYSTCLKADYENQEYYVQFKIPEGEILAIYDNKGEIIRTSEKFEDIRLPLAVSNAIVEKYPGWRIEGDIYLVNYRRNKEIIKKYKLFIRKGEKNTRVSTDENGNFL